MKEFIIGEGENGFTMNLPTKLNEITEDYLFGVTKHIRVAPYHAIVAMVHRCKLPEIISTAKKRKDLATAVVPIFVCAVVPSDAGEDTCNMFSEIKCGDKIIIGTTSLEMGNHLTCPKNFITVDNIVRIYNSDNNFAKGVMIDQNYYYFVDFKLIPINEIKGFYSRGNDDTFINPFIINNSKAS
jgi:hypothetical protein